MSSGAEDANKDLKARKSICLVETRPRGVLARDLEQL